MRALMRFNRLSLVLLLAGVLAFAAGGARSSAATARGHGPDAAVRARCVESLLGDDRAATPTTTSLAPALASEFALLHRPRTAADSVAQVSQLRTTLAGAGARRYEPAAAVLLRRTGPRAGIFAIPAMLAVPTSTRKCRALPRFAGVGSYLAMLADERGSGPGICLISTQLASVAASGQLFPGQPAPRPRKTVTATSAACESTAVLAGYVGALGFGPLASGPPSALIRDGISTVSYQQPNASPLSATVNANLLTPPAGLSLAPTTQPSTAAGLRQQLNSTLPTTMTESGSDGAAVATLTRPATLIGDVVGGFSFLRGLLRASAAAPSVSSGSSGPSCSAATHHCVVVTVTTTCDASERCRTTRTITRYRYVTAKPPRGSTGPISAPTGPIVARVNRYLRRPGKLALVLSGVPHRRVTVLLSTTCFGRNLAASSAGPPLELAVPSRTRIELPGRARSFAACDIGALVVSRARGAVRASVQRD